MTALSDNLLIRLQNADVVCKDCGDKYGRYSVGCSSSWVGECNVCEETKPVTEVRDYGYLAKGIADEKERIRRQSAEVAPQEDNEPASYEEGEITLKLTEAEVDFLNTWLETVEDLPGPEEVAVYETVAQKVYELYNDYCIKYELSPCSDCLQQKVRHLGNW